MPLIQREAVTVGVNTWSKLEAGLVWTAFGAALETRAESSGRLAVSAHSSSTHPLFLPDFLSTDSRTQLSHGTQ